MPSTCEGRPNASQRGYGRAWRKRREAHLERTRVRQESEGRPGGPWCECEACLGSGSPEKANTVDHRTKRRTFPIHLQGSDGPGGSDHPSNLRAMAAGHHSRRKDDKARRRLA
jgi:hypothetical protein